MLRRWFIGFASLLGLAPGFAATPEVRVRAEPATATVGDPITIDFEIVAPQGSQVRFPATSPTAGDFTILETYPGPTLPARPASARPKDPPDGQLHYRARIVAALYRVGDFEFPALEWTVVESDGRETRVRSQAVKISIRSVIAEKDPQLKDLKPQAEINEPLPWGWIAAVALALLLLAALAWWLWRGRRQPAPVAGSGAEVDPFAAAEAELQDLLRRGLLEKGSVKQFYVALADIVRKVVETGFAIATAERTTAEIVEDLRDLRAGELALIEQFLYNCDLVKFARYVPPASENQEAILSAREILDLCRRQRQAPQRAPAVAQVS